MLCYSALNVNNGRMRMSFIKIVVQKLDINLIAKIVIESAIKNRIVFAIKEIIIKISQSFTDMLK